MRAKQYKKTDAFQQQQWENEGGYIAPVPRPVAGGRGEPKGGDRNGRSRRTSARRQPKQRRGKDPKQAHGNYGAGLAI